MEFEIGQIWEISWNPNEALTAKPPKSRTGVLLGMDKDAGMVVKLWFSCPMIPGRRSNDVHVNEWPYEGARHIGSLITRGIDPA